MCMKKVELLAPAGNMDSLKAAVMKAKSSGISREDVLETVEFIYGGVTYDTN